MIFIKTLIISILAAALIYSSYSTSSVFAEPMDPNYSPENCKKEDKYGYVTCCWKKDGKTYCQACKTDGKTVQCGKVQGPIGLVPGESGPVFQGDDAVLEQPPTTNNPPIKSGDSVFPNNGGYVLDESQPTNPTFNSNKGTIIEDTLVEDQPMQFSSNTEQNEESKEFAETNNAETTSGAQENDDSSTSKTTASFAKKGNGQNSPVPPEYPKQGPIPPDCTMKPKF